MPLCGCSEGIIPAYNLPKTSTGKSFLSARLPDWTRVPHLIVAVSFQEFGDDQSEAGEVGRVYVSS